MTNSPFNSDPIGIALNAQAFTAELQPALRRWETIGEHNPRFVAELQQIGTAIAWAFRPFETVRCPADGERRRAFSRFWASQLRGDNPRTFVVQLQKALLYWAGIGQHDAAFAGELLALSTRCGKVFRQLVAHERLDLDHIFHAPTNPQEARDLHAFQLAELAMDELEPVKQGAASLGALLGRDGHQVSQGIQLMARQAFGQTLDTYTQTKVSATVQDEVAQALAVQIAIKDIARQFRKQLDLDIRHYAQPAAERTPSEVGMKFDLWMDHLLDQRDEAPPDDSTKSDDSTGDEEASE